MKRAMAIGSMLVATLLVAPGGSEKEQPCQVLTATGGKVILRCPEQQTVQPDDRVYLRTVGHRQEEGR